MTEAEAVQRYVQSQLDYAISNTPPEKMAQVTEDRINQFKVAATQRGESMAHDILRDKEALYKGHRAGRFHPDNRDSRRMFTDLTGIELPKTQKGTDPIIEVYIGAEFIKAWKDRRDAERAEKEAAERQRKADEHAAWISKIATCLAGDKPIGGDALLDYARHIGIKVHPRTAGTLLRRVDSIREGQAHVHRVRSGKKSHLPDAVWDLFHAVRHHATANLQPASVTTEA